MRFHDTPVKIGIEVEVQYPDGIEEHQLVGSPAGWDRGEDGGGQIEFRFGSPAISLRTVHRRLDKLSAYMKKWNLNNFSNCGTHIHLGMESYLKKRHSLTGYSVWYDSPAAILANSYFHSRVRTLFSLVPAWRPRSGWCSAPLSEVNAATPLWRIHNSMCINQSGTQYDAVSVDRNGWPTFEFRIFAGTNNTDAIKGYVALLLNMLHRMQGKLTKDFVENVRDPLNDTTQENQVPTRDFLVHPSRFDVPGLVREVRESGYWSESLVDWIHRTHRNKGEPTAFNGTLDEVLTTSTQSRPMALRAAA